MMSPTYTALKLAAVPLLCFLAAFTRAAGPGFYNATNATVQLDATLDTGPNFRAELPPRQELRFPDAHQVKKLEIRFVGDRKISVTEEKASMLRDAIDKPRNQVWVIDEVRICVVEARAFKPGSGFRCPVPAPSN